MLDRVRGSHHVFTRSERGGHVVVPLRLAPHFAGWSFGVITLDPAVFEDTIERVNVTLPRRVLKRLDALARAAGESRSSYIAQMTLDVPDRMVERAA